MSFFSKTISKFFGIPSEDDRAFIQKQVSEFDLALAKLDGRYISPQEENAFQNEWQSAYKKVKSIRLPRHNALYASAQHFFLGYEQLNHTIASYNDSYIAREKICSDSLLSDIDGKSLDDQQRTVVVTDAPRNLVLAGAGSGKTLTIVGKVKYLCQHMNVAPQDILLIAFTKKSAEEMTERISGRLGIPIQATTFHKLGLDIITDSSGTRPDVLDSLSGFVRSYFEEHLMQDPKAVRQLVEYFAYYLHIPADMEQFGSLGAAYEYEKGNDFETIRGKYDRAAYVDSEVNARRPEKLTLQNETVKSLEEVSIANFLFLNGVKYEYERLYPYKSEDTTYKPYRPDFYLPDYDIYIEHFGVNKHGKLPWLSEVEEQKYIEDMRWKRAFHQQNGTTLLETYSFYTSEGRLLEELERKLKEKNVRFDPPDLADIFNSVYTKESDKYFSEFLQLCCTFLTLFKSNGYKINILPSLQSQNRKYQTPFFARRTQLFKEIIAPILIAYDQHLLSNNAIDFSDMINRAADLVNGSYAIHPYKWIIIDEFQDISVARYHLVDAILKKTGAKLLCVGDDWQSIYRFAGSDITLFTHFEQFFGRAAIMRIEQTYRNAQQLIDEAGSFVMRNPAQMRKNLRSQKRLDYPITFMCYNTDPFALLARTVKKIIKEFGENSSIMLLGRTSHDLELVKQSGLFTVKSAENIVFHSSPQTPISFLTIHKSKGLEADNVVLLNFQNSTLGFPNKISDDPILDLVLTSGDEYLYAEERRLLYVALTRTRNRIFILTDENRPSEFFNEFRPSLSVFVLSNKEKETLDAIKCPRCKSGNLMVRKNESTYQYFVGCSHFPRCEYTFNDTSIMSNPKRCPKCNGFLVKRYGEYGKFYGCSNYPLCNYTEKIRTT